MVEILLLRMRECCGLYAYLTVIPRMNHEVIPRMDKMDGVEQVSDLIVI